MVIKNQGPSPNPNPLSFSEIEDEFGNNPGRSLGRYRASHADYENKSFSGADSAMLGNGNMPLDDGIPTGSNDPIRFSDFYSKQLNIIIDYYSGSNMNRTGTGGGNDTKQIATRRYINESTGPDSQNRVRVVGGYRTRPSGSVNSSQVLSSPSAQWQGGKKVIVHVNKTLGSEPGPEGRVALRTGQWPTGTELQLDIGDSGRILGAGGNGGSGSGGNGGDGEDGTSALGVEFGCHINKRPSGIIRCGYGGGGGGAGGSSNPNKNPTDFGRGGGGGGGGAGFPAGTGGSKGPDGFGPGPNPFPSEGGDGSELGEGLGGDGGNSSGGAAGGSGGNGGSSDNVTADKGGDGSGGGKGYGPGGTGGDGGSNGFGIIFRNSTVDNATDGVNDTPNPQGGDSNSQSIS